MRIPEVITASADVTANISTLFTEKIGMLSSLSPSLCFHLSAALPRDSPEHLLCTKSELWFSCYCDELLISAFKNLVGSFDDHQHSLFEEWGQQSRYGKSGSPSHGLQLLWEVLDWSLLASLLLPLHHKNWVSHYWDRMKSTTEGRTWTLLETFLFHIFYKAKKKKKSILVLQMLCLSVPAKIE